ncbi:hypothetical protein GGR57DRAFT_486627 [Xylariaceae sp. FL1272]|nr:hypothetical protein GGR57DRAFT_486627 [Xylariaceae sp. FL1272]
MVATGLEIVGLTLAVVATADLCIKYGDRIVELCSSYKHAEDELSERAVRVASSWMRVQTQLRFLQKIESTLSDKHRTILDQSLRIFSSKLVNVIRELESHLRPVDNVASVLRVKLANVRYAFTKQHLDKVLEELRKWDDEFDPTWYLTILIADKQVDEELHRGLAEKDTRAIRSAQSIRSALHDGNEAHAKNLSLPVEDLNAMQVQPIRFCDAKIAYGGKLFYILDDIVCCDEADTAREIFRQNIRDLARRLQHDAPETSGLLQSKGFVAGTTRTTADTTDTPQLKFTLVLRGIQGYTNPRSLREHLMSRTSLGSLSARFDMARNLARSVSYLHTFKFVHKNVRPETILTFERRTRNTRSTSLSTFLVGFGDLRAEYGRTAMRGDDAWERNLYRHPTRQGVDPARDYGMQHDIYALGVCLLEIGLWESFVVYADGGSCRPGAVLQLPPDTKMSPAVLVGMKDLLVAFARTGLPLSMGTEFAEIVETCLTCLDPDNIDFGDPDAFRDADGVSVGVRYIEKVLLRLNSLRV